MRSLRFALCGLFLFVGAVAASAAKYDVSGVAIHQCSCAYACPCMFENGPDDCGLAAVYHFKSGSVDGVSVGGLSMISIDGALAAHSSGGTCCGGGATAKSAKTNPPRGVVYLDAKADPAQRRALMALLQTHGEWPGAGRPVKSVPIQFAPTADGYTVTVPGLFRGETKRTLSRKGAVITVDGVGFPEGTRWTVGRSVVNDLHDAALGLNWHMPNTNGSWSLLHWTQP